MQDVNRVVYDLTFTQDAFNEIPYDQRLPNLMKSLILQTDRWDKVQKEAIKLAYMRFIDNASGDLLEKIAGRFFIDREGKGDETLRSAIKLRALRQDSEGTRSDVYKILQVLAGDGGLVAINKQNKKSLQVMMSVDCLNLSEIKVDIQNIFPINTNLEFLKYNAVSLAHKPFGVRDVNLIDPLLGSKVGTLGNDEDITSAPRNRVGLIIIDNEFEG